MALFATAVVFSTALAEDPYTPLVNDEGVPYDYCNGDNSPRERAFMDKDTGPVAFEVAHCEYA
jgi:hypothetical protein